MKALSRPGPIPIAILVLNAFPPGSQAALLSSPQAVSASPLMAHSQSAAGNSLSPQFSGDGRFLVFVSDAPNLVTNDDLEPHLDVFVYDGDTRQTQLVSVNTNGLGGGNATAHHPSISSNGQFVAFASTAGNLVPGDTNAASDIFVRDLLAGTTTLISRQLSSHTGPVRPSPFRPCTRPQLSADGRWLAYPDGTNVYVWDAHTGANQLVNVNRAGTGPGNASAYAPVLSPDGLQIAFLSAATDLAPGGGETGVAQLFLRDLVAQTTRLVSITPHRTATNLLASGLTITNPFDNRAWQVRAPVISGSGRFVAFLYERRITVDTISNPIFPSEPWLLHATATDLYLHDRLLNHTLLLTASSRADGLAPANHRTRQPVFSADGHTLVFESFASDLVPGDLNDRRDVFAAFLGGDDTDADGLDDDWELACFGTLIRNGLGDGDDDGHTDADEFHAGTDPTNDGSVLRVITVTAPDSAHVTILWNAVPGHTYRVQYLEDAASPAWNNLPDTITADGTTGFAVDATAGDRQHRFYRVLLVP
ncbi:MAG: PD40 domain-containing protein [Verrucomicrobia bacterium]|nr:PD40 domain-containing protein [Verrucomicrobiota bacterium]